MQSVHALGLLLDSSQEPGSISWCGIRALVLGGPRNVWRQQALIREQYLGTFGSWLAPRLRMLISTTHFQPSGPQRQGSLTTWPTGRLLSTTSDFSSRCQGIQRGSRPRGSLMICPPRRSGLLPRAGSSLDRLIGGLASLKLLPYRAKSPPTQPAQVRWQPVSLR